MIRDPLAIFHPDLFAGLRVVVTGGGTGIGKETARLFLRLGARVFIGSRTAEKLERAAAELAPEGRGEAPIGWATVDTRDPERVAGFVDEAVAFLGSIDVLVNNAGGQFPSPAEALTPKGFDAVIRNNLHGTWHMTQTVATKVMIPAERGVVVNVVANMWRGFPGLMHTGAARAAVVNMTKTLAVEWARYHIRVNAVAPGVIATEGLKVYPPEVIRGVWTKIPMMRLGTPQETAAVIAFLASPGAGYITGATIRMDGGQSLWGDTWLLPEPAEPLPPGIEYPPEADG